MHDSTHLVLNRTKETRLRGRGVTTLVENGEDLHTIDIVHNEPRDAQDVIDRSYMLVFAVERTFIPAEDWWLRVGARWVELSRRGDLATPESKPRFK